MEAKYDRIGLDYDQTRKADIYLTGRLLRHLNPKEEGTYLDIGCGTGNYTNELQKLGYNFIGVDSSNEMLEKAKNRNPNVDWRLGTAEYTGLPNNCMDGIMATLTIHHWTNLKKGCQEMHRILKEGGKMVIFTATPQQMEGYWLNHYFPKMLKDSIHQMPLLEKVENTLKHAGFQSIDTEKYFVRPDLQDKFLYCGKQDPNLYFNEKIRNGISSFSSLANQEEVAKGLEQLKNDIDNGSVHDVIKSFENDLGDYLYIIAE